MLYFGKSDIGRKRSNNQDTFVCEELCQNASVYVVCDGMGGARGGKEASTLASELFLGEIKEGLAPYIKDGVCSFDDIDITELIVNSVYDANTVVFGKAKEDPSLSGMGTTLVAALVLDDAMYVVNVGDSRMYIYSDGELSQVTHDHSYVQYLIDIGQITREEAKDNPNRNIIMRAVGIEDEVEADLFRIDIKSYGAFSALLCSDGLTSYADLDSVKAILASDMTAEEKANSLIDAANEAGGGDNITVILIVKEP